MILGAAVVAVLSTSYLGFINCLCCAGVIAGAMAAVWHYTNTNELTIATGEGAVMGLVAGALGAVVAFFLNYALLQMGLGAEEAIREVVMNMFADQMSTEQIEEMERQMESGSSFGARAVNGLIGVVVSAIFGAIGGAIGAAVFKKGSEEDGAIA